MEVELDQKNAEKLAEGLRGLMTQMKENQTPSLRAVVDYCRLHHTTGDESYRLRAVDTMRMYEKTMRFGDNLVAKPVEIVYTEVLKELGVNNPELLLGALIIAQPEMAPLVDGLEKVVNMLRERTDFAPLHDWRNHCLSCKVPDATCGDNVNKLESRYQARLVALESAWDGLLEAARPYVGKLAKEVASGNVFGPGFGSKKPSLVAALRTGR